MQDEKVTFTKLILSIVMVLYFMGAILGAVLMIINAIYSLRLGDLVDSQFYIAYSAYLGGPTATAIGFYAWKSKAENILKIHYGNQEKIEERRKESENNDGQVEGQLDMSILANMEGD